MIRCMLQVARGTLIRPAVSPRVPRSTFFSINTVTKNAGMSSTMQAVGIIQYNLCSKGNSHAAWTVAVYTEIHGSVNLGTPPPPTAI